MTSYPVPPHQPDRPQQPAHEARRVASPVSLHSEELAHQDRRGEARAPDRAAARRELYSGDPASAEETAPGAAGLVEWNVSTDEAGHQTPDMPADDEAAVASEMADTGRGDAEHELRRAADDATHPRRGGAESHPHLPPAHRGPAQPSLPGFAPGFAPVEPPHSGNGHGTAAAADRLIANHAEFLAAIRDRKLIRIVFHANPHSGTVDRECAPLDYGPDLWGPGRTPLYWIGNDTHTAESIPLGLSARQIINVHVLERTFDPAKLQVPGRPWFVLRDWGNAAAIRPRDQHQRQAPFGPA